MEIFLNDVIVTVMLLSPCSSVMKISVTLRGDTLMSIINWPISIV